MITNATSLRDLILQKNIDIIDPVEALKLIERVKRIELHAHTYAFYLNLQHGTFDILISVLSHQKTTCKE